MSAGEDWAELRDIHPPDPVGLWPPAPGWWLSAAALLLLAVLALWGWRRWHRRRYRRAALRALRQCYRRYRLDGDAALYLQTANAILKRAALAAFPRQRVASLHGDQWPRFLVASGGDPTLEDGPGDLLSNAYRPAGESDPRELAQLQQLLEDWIRRHRCG